MGSTTAENGGGSSSNGSAGAAPRPPKRDKAKPSTKTGGVHVSFRGPGGGGDDGSTIASRTSTGTSATTKTMSTQQLGAVVRSTRARSTSMFQRPTHLQSATVWDVISPPVRLPCFFFGRRVLFILFHACESVCVKWALSFPSFYISLTLSCTIITLISNLLSLAGQLCKRALHTLWFGQVSSSPACVGRSPSCTANRRGSCCCQQG